MQEHNRQPATTDESATRSVSDPLNDAGLPGKVSTLRRKLYRKAKDEPKFRFYALYDRITRPDVLRSAWDRVARNDGAPGVDGVSIADVVNSAQGVDRWLAELRQSLVDKTYRPQPVKRVYIPKPNGTKRPLGVPTVRDRVVQMAAVLILEPIFEADFLDCSFGFRPNRSAHEALEEVGRQIQGGRREVYDVDLQSYFDSIPHDKLMACVRMRVTDRSVLSLIRMWLKAVVIEADEDSDDPPKASRPKQGTPQGGVISPLLSNLYLHWLDKLFHRSDGPYHWANARLVRYADDFVIVARHVGGRIRDFVESTVEDWMALRINREKTGVIRLAERGAELDFLGYTFRYERDRYGRGHWYLNMKPSKKALERSRRKVRGMTGPEMCFKPVVVLIGEINRYLHGWSGYFSAGYPSEAYRQVNRYVRQRLKRHLQRRSQRPCRPPAGMSYYEHLHRMGLVYLKRC